MKLKSMTTLSMIVLASAALAQSAFAGVPVVYSPMVTKGQTEIELRASQDNIDGAPNVQQAAVAVGHAFTSWWQAEIYLGRYERETGGSTVFAGTEFENIFQLTPAGRYWANVGFLAAYEINPADLESDKVEFGPLFEKQSGRVVQRLNLLWEKGVGAGSDSKYEFGSAYSFQYQKSKTFAPGFELYAAPDDDAYQGGPVLYGEKVFSPGKELEYSFGALAPLSDSAPDSTLVFRLEYEFL